MVDWEEREIDIIIAKRVAVFADNFDLQVALPTALLNTAPIGRLGQHSVLCKLSSIINAMSYDISNWQKQAIEVPVAAL